MKPYLESHLGVSVISVMELLSFPGITEEEDRTIRTLLSHCEVLGINDDIREKTIQTKRTQKVKLPDAIIAATAMTHELPLITADAGLFDVDGLQIEKLLLA